MASHGLIGMNSTSTVVDIKQLIVRSGAYFANLMAYLVAALIILPLALRRSARHCVQIPRHWPAFVGMALFAC
jgi:hypothetical protein